MWTEKLTCLISVGIWIRSHNLQRDSAFKCSISHKTQQWYDFSGRGTDVCWSCNDYNLKYYDQMFSKVSFIKLFFFWKCVKQFKRFNRKYLQMVYCINKSYVMWVYVFSHCSQTIKFHQSCCKMYLILVYFACQISKTKGPTVLHTSVNVFTKEVVKTQ